MFRQLFVVSLLLLATGCANQKVQDAYLGNQSNTALVTSSPTVLISYVDNEEVREGYIGQEITYRVDAGKRTVLVSYSDMFSTGPDSFEKVVSRPAKITFSAETGKAYRIENPSQTDLSAAQAFSDHPEFSVVDAATGAVVVSAIELSRPRTFLTQLKSAATPVYAFESDQIQSNVGQTVAPAAATPQAPSGTLDQLKTMWGNASEVEREAFLKWMNQQ